MPLTVPERYKDGRVPIMGDLLSTVQRKLTTGAKPAPVLTEDQQEQLAVQALNRGDLAEPAAGEREHE